MTTKLEPPGPSDPIDGRAEVFLTYLEYFRTCLVDRVTSLSDEDLRTSRLASNWTPIELVMHLRHVERRWLEWGFLGAEVDDPWGDQRDRRWYVEPGTPLPELLAALAGQATRTREIVESHDLADIGEPGERWDGDPPPSLERILFHLVQEYARHVGHLDVVAELAGGTTGE